MGHKQLQTTACNELHLYTTENSFRKIFEVDLDFFQDPPAVNNELLKTPTRHTEQRAASTPEGSFCLWLYMFLFQEIVFVQTCYT